MNENKSLDNGIDINIIKEEPDSSNKVNDLIENNKEEEKINININNDINDLNNENNQYQNSYINKVEMMEFLIDIIKKNSYTKIKNEIIEKNKEKKELENNINILNSKINSIKMQKKNFKALSKSLQSEMLLIDKNIRKMSKDLYCEDELFQIKYEINILLNKVKKEKETLANSNINISETKREIHIIKDEIKKYNNIIRKLKAENDIYINSIRLLDKHIILAKEKLGKQNDKTNDFFIALTNLAIKSKKCEMERKTLQNKNNKRAKSCKGPRGKQTIYSFNFL
jgi:hypothetical protein